MKLHQTLAALAVPLMLAACDTRLPSDPPRPQATTPAGDAGSPLARSTERVETGPKGDAQSLPPNPSSSAAPTPADGAKDSPATAPLSPLSESEEKAKMPLAGHGNNHSSDSMKAGTSQQ
ncbi:MAG TPA: hypothetical protein VK052_07930 [Zeimonas sp.]|nr:hypothetical protein [Zeimonas sp.]